MPTTNQRMFYKTDKGYVDITAEFWNYGQKFKKENVGIADLEESVKEIYSKNENIINNIYGDLIDMTSLFILKNTNFLIILSTIGFRL